MRPLVARCHLDLGLLARRIGKAHEAQEALTAAVALFGALGMLDRATSALADPS